MAGCGSFGCISTGVPLLFGLKQTETQDGAWEWERQNVPGFVNREGERRDINLSSETC